jgi:hypothetical protein
MIARQRGVHKFRGMPGDSPISAIVEISYFPPQLCCMDGILPCARRVAPVVERGVWLKLTDRIVLEEAHGPRGPSPPEGLEVARHGHGNNAHDDGPGLGYD